MFKWPEMTTDLNPVQPIDLKERKNWHKTETSPFPSIKLIAYVSRSQGSTLTLSEFVRFGRTDLQTLIGCSGLSLDLCIVEA